MADSPVISMIFTVLRYVKISLTFVKLLPVLTNYPLMVVNKANWLAKQVLSTGKRYWECHFLGIMCATTLVVERFFD